jgi:hypothetical protein
MPEAKTGGSIGVGQHSNQPWLIATRRALVEVGYGGGVIFELIVVLSARGRDKTERPAFAHRKIISSCSQARVRLKRDETLWGLVERIGISLEVRQHPVVYLIVIGISDLHTDASKGDWGCPGSQRVGKVLLK